MFNKYITVCVAAVFPLGFVASAVAQSTTPVQPTEQQGDGGYSLKGSTLKAPGANAQQTTAAPYEISGSSISGATKVTEVILTTPVDANAAPFKTDSGLYLYPTAFAGFGYNSNVGASGTAIVGSSFYNVAPQLVAEIKNKGDRYTALVSANSTRYTSSVDDNSNKSEVGIAGDNYFTSRARAGWSIGQVNGTDPRSSNVRTTVDQWHSTNLNGRMIYGAPEASGRVEIDVGNQIKAYDNTGTDRLDLTLTSVAGRVFYRLGTRTLALAEVRNAQAKYASALSTASSNTERRYYAGLTWEASAATTGIIKVGRMTKDFSEGATEAYGGGSWEATVRWLPLSYSAVDFQTAKTTGDSSGVGNYQVLTSNDIIWNHHWTRSVTSRISVGALTTDFAGTGRTDTATNYALTLDYSVLRWLKIGVDFATTDNTSTDPNAVYKRNITMFTLNASL